jgi:hypothetical protein
LCQGPIRQHRPTGCITDGKDMINRSATVLINRKLPVRFNGKTGWCQIKTTQIG